jgi:enoyl-CoA hydratase/carnithine racemase
MTKMAARRPAHFLGEMKGDVAVIQLNRPDRKNPPAFESYAELRDTFRDLRYADDVNAVVFLSNGSNFCSGGDGVRHGHIVESLYREIRALRIYEGASEVQKVVIARQTLSEK